MDKVIVKQLVNSIILFLKEQVRSPGCLGEEGSESVEVALQCLQSAYNIQPSDAVPPFSLYDLYSEALGVSNQAAQISDADREEADKLKEEGNRFIRENKYEDALGLYTKAILKNPFNPVYYCNRASAYSKLNQHESAVSDCEKAIELDPSYSRAYGRMGWAYDALGNLNRAKDCYKKASELEPSNESYLNNLRLVEEKLGTQGPANPTANLFSSLGSGMPGLGPFATMAGLGSGASGESGGAGGPNIGNLLNNPDLLNMASQMMNNPNMQNLMSSILGGNNQPPQTPPEAATNPNPSAANSNPSAANSNPSANSGSGLNMEFLLNAGRQLAEQIETQNPQLVEQIRSQLDRSNIRRDQNRDGNNQS